MKPLPSSCYTIDVGHSCVMRMSTLLRSIDTIRMNPARVDTPLLWNLGWAARIVAIRRNQ